MADVLSDGSFFFVGIPPGNYVVESSGLSVSLLDGNLAEVSLEADSNLNLNLVLSEAPSIVLSIVDDASGVPVDNVAFSLRTDLTNNSSQFRTGEGEFLVTGLENGTYTLVVDSPGFARLSQTIDISELESEITIRLIEEATVSADILIDGVPADPDTAIFITAIGSDPVSYTHLTLPTIYSV